MHLSGKNMVINDDSILGVIDFDLATIDDRNDKVSKIIPINRTVCKNILPKTKCEPKISIKDSIKQILKNSHDAGISNCVFIMFGFPGETKKSFEDTIELIKQDYIDFISCSTFGLQKDTRIEKNPEQFKIKKIIKKRTILSDNYSFENLDNNSLSKTELEQIKLKYSPLLNAKNKWTDKINFYRNHILVLNE